MRVKILKSRRPPNVSALWWKLKQAAAASERPVMPTLSRIMAGLQPIFRCLDATPLELI